MAEDDAGLRDRNVAIATELMERFGHDMDGWYDHLHDDIVMEFPFGACVGMPTRIEGRASCAAVFQTVSSAWHRVGNAGCRMCISRCPSCTFNTKKVHKLHNTY